MIDEQVQSQIKCKFVSSVISCCFLFSKKSLIVSQFLLATCLIKPFLKQFPNITILNGPWYFVLLEKKNMKKFTQLRNKRGKQIPKMIQINDKQQKLITVIIAVDFVKYRQISCSELQCLWATFSLNPFSDNYTMKDAHQNVSIFKAATVNISRRQRKKAACPPAILISSQLNR